MATIAAILSLVRSINADEFQAQISTGDGLEDVHKELLFLAKKIESQKKRTNSVIQQLSNIYTGDFFNCFPTSNQQDEVDLLCAGLNKYVQEFKAMLDANNVLVANNTIFKAEKEQYEQMLRARDEFLFSISHEIRAPLNGIIGFTDLLLKNPALHSDVKKQLDYIMMSADFLLVIINDILDVAKIESGQMSLNEKPFEIAKLIQLVCDAFSAKIQENNLSFETAIGLNVPPVLYGDAVRVAQILFNLMSNAIKFTNIEGKISLIINFEKENTSFYFINIIAEDSGIGIPEDKIDAIFEPFVQATDDSLKKHAGTGLGLTIIKKIINMMNGKIEVTSTLGVGTKFTVNLPFAKLNNETNTELLTAKNLPEGTIDKSKRLKVLLAEDNKINQLLAQKVLSLFDFDCLTVDNGSLAVEAVVKEDFDVILMDIMMPVMNGFEAAKIIRSLPNETKKNIPIVAITAVVTGAIIEDCINAGINSYVSKPFVPETLYDAIAKLVY